MNKTILFRVHNKIDIEFQELENHKWSVSLTNLRDNRKDTVYRSLSHGEAQELAKFIVQTVNEDKLNKKSIKDFIRKERDRRPLMDFTTNPFSIGPLFT